MGIRNIVTKLINRIIEPQIKSEYIPIIYGDSLNGKNIIITGGASGIGYSIAEACLRNGANVLIMSRSTEKLKKSSKTLENIGGSIYYLSMDIKDINSMDRKLEAAIEMFPEKRIDILVNNAGVAFGHDFGDTDHKSFNDVMDTNLKGTYFLSQIFSNYLIENKIRGNILNISSVSGKRPAISPYMVSKWAEQGLTKGLAKKLIPYDIVVNAIAPGPTATGILNIDDSDLYHKDSPARRFVTANEVANLAVFMLSDMGRMIIGETIYITGGSGTLTYDDIKY